MRIDIPAGAKEVLGQLHKKGFEAYIVGGCVRDALMGRCPNDWDITTSALPAEVKACFPKTIDTGIEHGTVTVRLHGESYEVTTYRIDGKYEDGRHPTSVTFTPSLTEDLKRRDFTVNAMAWNEEEGLVDLFGGMEDIEHRIIRCVGDPVSRFSEDALRMLRALRFSAQLDFAIEEKTFSAISDLADTLTKISAERIRVELLKLITSAHPERMMEVYKSGLSKVFFPEWDAMCTCTQNSKHHAYDVAEHTIVVMQNVPGEKMIRLAALLHDVAKPICKKTDPKGADHFSGHPTLGAKMAVQILRRLKFDNATIDSVERLVRYHDERPEMTKRNVRRLMHRMGSDCIPDLVALKRADIAGQSDYNRQEKLHRVDELERLYREILKDGEAVTIKDLKVNGQDVMEVAGKSGPEIGRVLKELLDEVIEDPSKNDREYLLHRIGQ